VPDLFIKLVESIGDPDPLSVWIFGLALIALLFLRVPKLRHRRYRMGVVFLLLPLLSTITLFIQDTIGLLAAGALIGIVGVPVAWWLFTTAMRRDALLFEKAMIRSLRDLVHAGDFSRATRRSTQKQWFLLSVPAKLKWSFLKAKAHSDQGEFKEAYAIYDRLLSLPLFQEERIEVQLQQIYSLCALGDTLRATKTFHSIDGAISSGYYRYWARALLAERAGELEAARTNWLHAVGEDVPASAKLAKGYNNLGRIEGILRNRTQALHFYRKATSLVSQSQDKMVLHSVYPNTH
jgi:hypothetical protein